MSMRTTPPSPAQVLLAAIGLACSLALGAAFGGCETSKAPAPADPPRPSSPAAPEPAAMVEVAPAPAPARPRDALGRLEPAEAWPSGFPVPQAAVIRSQAPGSAFYDIKADAKALEEFYAHRRFAVQRQARGFKVVHTKDTRDDARARGLEVGATNEVHVVPIASRRFALRYFGHVNAIEGPSGATAAPPPALPPPGAPPPPAPGTLTPSEVPGARRATRQHPARPFNPTEPPGRGAMSVAPRIEAWKAANPTRSFAD